jgi:hypothetical protein
MKIKPTVDGGSALTPSLIRLAESYSVGGCHPTEIQYRRTSNAIG